MQRPQKGATDGSVGLMRVPAQARVRRVLTLGARCRGSKTRLTTESPRHRKDRQHDTTRGQGEEQAVQASDSEEKEKGREKERKRQREREKEREMEGQGGEERREGETERRRGEEKKRRREKREERSVSVREGREGSERSPPEWE